VKTASSIFPQCRQDGVAIVYDFACRSVLSSNTTICDSCGSLNLPQQFDSIGFLIRVSLPM
jgi:hypothetical protein